MNEGSADFLQGAETSNGKSRPTTPSTPAAPTPGAPVPAKQQKGWGRLPDSPTPPLSTSSEQHQQQERQRQGPWGNGPAASSGPAHRASLRAIAAAQNHTANMLKAQVTSCFPTTSLSAVSWPRNGYV
jgi:hypothetical protein